MSTTTPFEWDGQPSKAKPDAPSFDLRMVVGIARRHWLLLTIIPTVVILGALVYVLMAQPIYLAKAQVLLDTRKLQLFQNQALVSDPSFEAAAVESQMELIRSDTIASSVVEDLRLAEDPEFTGEPTTAAARILASAVRILPSRIADRIVGPPVSSPEQRLRAAVDHFRANLQIQRLRTTYVIEVGFTSIDPVKAANVANAVSDAYILDQTQSKQYTTRRAMNWLQERMGELREQAITADRAVQDFRTKNNLVKVGSSNLTDQQFADLTAQLSRARDATAETRLRLERLREVMKSRVPDAAMAAWLGNDIINRLRQAYVDTQRRESELTLRLGPDHQAVLATGKELRQIEQSATKELARIASGYENEVETAELREKALEQKLATETGQNSAARNQQGALQLLESTARNYSSLYDMFFQRYLEASQQQNFSTSEARTITPAAPGTKISPNPQKTLPMAVVFGLALGCGVAFLRDRVTQVLRTSTEFERVLGVECLGILPAVDAAPLAVTYDVDSQFARIRGERVIHEDHGVSRQVLLQPFSRFAETVRNVKVTVDTNSTELKTIGVVSAVPAEGKSTVAANLAQLAASTGRRTLLIDADLRQPSLTRLLAPTAKMGLLEVLDGSASVTNAVWKDGSTGLEFLPAILNRRLANTSEILSSPAMARLLDQARDLYDYIILDFPPLAPVVDAKAASHLVDGYLIVVEWGRTSPSVVSETLASADTIRSRVIGGVLNRAQANALAHLEAYKGSKYHGYYTE